MAPSIPSGRGPPIDFGAVHGAGAANKPSSMGKVSAVTEKRMKMREKKVGRVCKLTPRGLKAPRRFQILICLKRI